MILGFIYHAVSEGSVSMSSTYYANTVELGHGYLNAIPGQMEDVMAAMLPIAAFFLIFQFISLHLNYRSFFRIVIGLLMTLTGVTTSSIEYPS